MAKDIKKELIDSIKSLDVPREQKRRRDNVAKFLATRHIPNNPKEEAKAEEFLELAKQELQASRPRPVGKKHSSR